MRGTAFRRASFAPGRSTVALVALALCTPTWDARAEPGQPVPAPARVQVKGRARIDARAGRASGRLVLSGTLTDDTARPLAGAKVTVALARVHGTDGAAVAVPSLVPLTAAAPESCGGAAAPALEGSEWVVLPTDPQGQFCVRLRVPTDRYVAHVEARSTGLVDGARADVAVDLTLPPVSLRFDPERTSVSLDDETTTFDVIASTDDDGVTAPAARLPLTLSNETGAVLGEARTDAAGRVRFAVPGAKVGSPGKGELRVAFAGSGDAGASTRAIPIERRTRVELSLPDAAGGRLPEGSPDEGVPVRVAATARCARPREGGGSGCAATVTGTVEARVGADGAIAGAAPIEAGEARVVVALPRDTATVEGAAEVPVRFRYVPDAPWFETATEISAVQPVRPPSPWKKVALFVAGLAQLAWLALARLSSRARAAESKVGAGARDESTGEARVSVVGEAAEGTGWSGRVIDADDGVPVAAAHVAVERRRFDGVSIVVEATCDEGGVFALEPAAVRADDELVVEGPWHAPLRRPAPATGQLEIALVLRKRALLDRLVAWARRRGRPYDARPDATPGHVRRAAGSEFGVARWADAVERAAYAGGSVDAKLHAEVERLAPADPPANPDAPPDPRARVRAPKARR